MVLFIQSLTKWGTDRAKRVPLRTILIVPFIVQIFVIGGITSYISFTNGQRAINELATQLSDTVNSRIELHVRNYLDIPHLIHQINSTSVDNGNLDVSEIAELETLFWEQVQVSESVGSIYFGNEQGDFVGIQERETGETVSWFLDQSVSPVRETHLLNEQGQREELLDTQDYDPRQRPWYKSASDVGQPTWSSIYRFASQDYAILGITPAVPIYNDADQLQGVLAIDLPLAEISQFLRELEISENGEAFILERSGEIVASSVEEPPFTTTEDGFERLQAVDSTNKLIQLTSTELVNQFGSLEEVDQASQSVFELNGERHFVQITNLQDGRGLDWLVVIAIPESDFMSGINASTRFAIGVTFLALVLAGVIGWLTYRWLVRSLIQLNQAAKSFSEGQWDERVVIERKDELGELATSFNTMAGQLQESFSTLETQNHELQRLDKLKDEFLANTSHELRTPLNGIVGLAESMVEGATGELTSLQVENLSLIVSSGQRLNNLINDLLDLSQLKHDKLTLDRKPIRLAELTELVVTLSKPLIGAKYLRIVNTVPYNLPSVFVDENRIQQILLNLIENGIKFSDDGEINISANVVGNFVEISISDTGVGIPKDKQEQIFLPFEQADGSIVREYGGTGIGLAVTRQLVELHDGEIWVESTPNEGSIFTFTLPLATDQPVEENPSIVEVTPALVIEETELVSEAEVEVSSQREFHILVVDDEPVNRQVLHNHLSLDNYQVTSVTDGVEALKLLQGDASPFDLIILDVMMPRMSGYEVCRRIRQTIPATDLPIIMLTAKYQTADLLAGFEAGANDYLVKPFSGVELLARIRTHLQLTDLRALNASKDKFFAIVAHDLKKPFQPLLGYTEFLAEIAEDASPDELQRMSQNIHRSARNVYSLLENLLQWSRMQRGHMIYSPILVDLSQVAAQNIELLEANATAKRIALNSEITPGTIAYADERMINTVLRNLISNAIKFTDVDGQITISAKQTFIANYSEEFVEVSVADTGIGMREEQMAKLFDIGENMSTLGTANEQGTGLGLLICHDMIRRNSGEIWVESQLGEGTTFRFTLPTTNVTTSLVLQTPEVMEEIK